MNHVLCAKTLKAEIGKISPFGDKGADASRYLPCVGDEVLRSQYAELFIMIGEAFGAGDGTTTFRLPDFRGRSTRNVDQGTGRDPDSATRTASNSGGATGDNVGSAQLDEFKKHSHSYTYANWGTDDDDANDKWQARDYNRSHATTPAGGNETRPKNVSIKYFIRYA